MVIWVFVPSVVKYNISDEVVRTFDGVNDIVIVKELTNTVIYDYSNKALVNKAITSIKKNIDAWYTESFKYDKDKIYIVLVGGILHAIATVKALAKYPEVVYDFLVYEKKLGKYVVLDGESYEVIGTYMDETAEHEDDIS